MKLPLSYPPIRKSSKSTLSQICSRQERELIALRSEIAGLRAKASTVAAPPSGRSEGERAAAKEKLFAEITAAKEKRAEFLAKEAIDKPERDRRLTEVEAQTRAARLAHRRKADKARREANPELMRERKRGYEKNWWGRLTPEEQAVRLDKKRAKHRLHSKEYRAANPERVKETVNAWRAKNREKANADRKAWAAANPEKVRAQNDRRNEKAAAKRLAKQILAQICSNRRTGSD